MQAKEAIVSITGSGSELQGVGHLEDGRVVFVRGALPGEEVRIAITKESARFCEGRLIDVVSASPERIESVCPYADRCGGCDARHMNYQYSLKLKRERVYSAISRIAGVREPAVFETLGCPDTPAVRNKAEYAVHSANGHTVIGVNERSSKRVIGIKQCLLQAKESNEILEYLQNNFRDSEIGNHLRYIVTRVNRAGRSTCTFSCNAPVGKTLLSLARKMKADLPHLDSVFFCLLKRNSTHALDGTCSCLAGSEAICDTLNDLTFQLSPQSFFQVNPIQAEALYKIALDAVIDRKDMSILDVYCGAGTITLSAARRCSHATGVEIVRPAIENAKVNAGINGLSDRTEFICADAAAEIPKLIKNGRHFDSVILDPPRKGADEKVLRAVADAGMPSIAYISCDPGTLARDIRFLLNNNYRFVRAQPVDMFPYTKHVETVVLMSRKDT